MTISTEVRKAGPFIGNDSASVFPFAFKVFKAADLIVVRRQDNIGEETTLVLDSDYHVTLNGNQDTTPGGVVALVAGALASGFTLVVSSELPYLQPTDLTNQGGFYPKVITNALDRLTIFCQQLAEITGRTLKLPITAPTNISAEIPLPNPSELIAWNETGTGLTTVSPQSLVTSIAYGSATADLFAGDGVTTTFPLSTNPASVNNLDVSIDGHSQRPVQGGIGDYSWNGGASITFAEPPPAPSIPGDKNVLVRYMQAIPVSDSEALHAQTREALRRSYADAGLNLVEGSFEEGGELLVASDVMITAPGDGYSWGGLEFPHNVAKGTDPTLAGSGYVPRTGKSLRTDLLDGLVVVRNGKLSSRDYVSVKDFGATGDGITDDTAAIHAAIASSNVVCLYFPAGTYLVSGIYVANKDAVILKTDTAKLKLIGTLGTDNVVAPVVKVHDTPIVSICGFEIDGNKANQKQIAEANRSTGDGIQVYHAVYLSIVDNHIHDTVSGAAIEAGQGGMSGMPDYLPSVSCLISDNVIENVGHDKTLYPSVAACDGMFCNMDNAVITRNRICGYTDVGIAHDFSVNVIVSNNIIKGKATGIQGIACYGSAYVTTVNNTISAIGIGINYNDQGNPAWTTRNILISGNDIRGVKSVIIPGPAVNQDGITVINSAGSTYARIVDNIINGGDTSITFSGVHATISGNDCFGATDKSLRLTGQYINAYGNKTSAKSIVPLARYSNISIEDVGVSQKRIFDVQSVFPAYARPCYVKTDDTVGDKQCIVEISAVGKSSVVGLLTVLWRGIIKESAGTVSVSQLAYEGDTPQLDVAVSPNGVSRVEVLVRANSSIAGTVTASVQVDVLSLEAVDPFYISEII